MTETIRFKNVVKLFLLAIVVGIMAVALPATLSERIDAESYEFGREAVYELKNDLIDRVERVWELDESEFTNDSWSTLYTTAVEVNAMLTTVGYRLDELEVFRLEIEILADSEEFAESFNHEIQNLEAYYQELLEELERLEEALETDYNALISADEPDDTYDEELVDEATLLQEARAELYDFLTYLSTLTEEDFDGEAWANLQEVIAQAELILSESDNIEEIHEILETLREYYQLLLYSRIRVELLSITRAEFESMTREELEERVEEGGYMELGFVSGGRIRSANACPNIDGGYFVTNTIVDQLLIRELL